MKNQFLFLLFMILAFFHNSILADNPPEFKYIGVDACGRCHKSEKQGSQMPIWKESIHSHAYKTLQTSEAKQIAEDMGFDKHPTELTECLICHASGFEVEESLLTEGFNKEDGVQCETCHGPGSEYKSLKVMKNRELAVQKGLLPIYNNTENFCVSCHNPDSPTFSGFDFEVMWAKIEHYVPVKKKEN